MVIPIGRVFLEKDVLLSKGCFALGQVACYAEGGLLFATNVFLKIIVFLWEKSKPYRCLSPH